MSTAGPHPFACGCVFIDGEIVPVAEAKISIFDWGFTRGDACQDTISIRRGMFFRLDDHLARFRKSCSLLRYHCPYSTDEIAGILKDLALASGLTEATVQVIMTRGEGPAGTRDPRECHNRFMAYCVPFVRLAKLEQLRCGLSLRISQNWRLPSESVPSGIKNYHWIDFVLSLFEAYDEGDDTAVLLGHEGFVTEGPGFNIFALFGAELAYPERNVLDGITRRTVIELCADIGQTCALRNLRPDDLRKADEIFVSTTAGGIIPIIRIDGKAVGNGQAGSLTLRLMDLYWNKRDSGWYGTPIQ